MSQRMHIAKVEQGRLEPEDVSEVEQGIEPVDVSEVEQGIEPEDSSEMNQDKIMPEDSSEMNQNKIVLDHISKSYQDKMVLQDFSLQLTVGGIYCLMGASGIGKTTLLRILMGLEQPDGRNKSNDRENPDEGNGIKQRKSYNKKRSDAAQKDCGVITGLEQMRISAVFQENRLFEFADAVKNIRLAAGREGLLSPPEELLEGLLERDAWKKPVSQLSGGMQRRVAVLRALAVKSKFLIMDEPFTGLDPETKERLIAAILTYRNNRTLLVVTHQEEDAKLLGAEIIRM